MGRIPAGWAVVIGVPLFSAITMAVLHYVPRQAVLAFHGVTLLVLVVMSWIARKRQVRRYELDELQDEAA